MIDQKVYESVQCLVKEVGQFQLQHFRAVPQGAIDRKALRETVSYVDVESERRLIEGLKGLVSQAGFFGEESGRQGHQDLVWVIDPLDGTTNYLQGLEQFSISVALVEHGRVLLGVVYKPASGELFAALRGQGLCYNGEIIENKSQQASCGDVLYGTGFPYRSEDLAACFFKTAPKVLSLGLGIRRFGSAALDLCYLSAGWLGGFWETDLEPYDVAAGLLFLEESGVKVTNGKGEEYSMGKDRLLIAAQPKVYPDLFPLIEEGYRELGIT